MFEYFKQFVVNDSKDKNELKHCFYRVGPDEIEKAENDIGKQFPEELKQFYQDVGYGYFDTISKKWLNLLMSPTQIADYIFLIAND